MLLEQLESSLLKKLINFTTPFSLRLVTSERLVRVDRTSQIKSHPSLPNFQQRYETFSMIRFLVFLIWLLCIPITAIADSLEDASKFTVRVRTSIQYSFAKDSAGTLKAAAFLVDVDNRYLVTNAHVAGRGNANIEVAFKGHEYVSAEAIYVDPLLDIAILQIESDSLPEEAIAAEMDCSNRSLNGIGVAAYGHPNGLSFSASRGIISQLRTYNGDDWVQTDAAINPGNSGGALIDLETGHVVGINAKGFKDTEGLYFAVPMTPACSIVKLLREGITASPPTLPLIFATNDELDKHLTIAGNLYGPLPKGIIAGDFLETVNGATVTSPNEVRELLRGYTGTVELGLLRNEERFKTTIEVYPREAVLERDFILMDGALISTDIYPDRRMSTGFFQVHSIAEGSRSAQSDLSTFHIITSVNGKTPESLEHLYELLNSGQKLSLIMRKWASSDNYMFEYLHINYRAKDVKLHER